MWHISQKYKLTLDYRISHSTNHPVTEAEEGSQFRGLISQQQEKLSMVKIEFYGGLLKWGGALAPKPPLSAAYALS